MIDNELKCGMWVMQIWAFYNQIFANMQTLDQFYWKSYNLSRYRHYFTFSNVLGKKI